VIKTTDDSKNLQNFLIACEMLPASIFMLWAFPFTDYKASGMSMFCLLLPAMVHIVVSPINQQHDQGLLREHHTIIRCCTISYMSHMRLSVFWLSYSS